MATVSAASEAPARPLWQIPTFLLGLVAFLAVWQGWVPLTARDPAAAYLDDLAALRAACDKLAPDREEIKTLLDRVSRNADSYPEHAPTAHFVMGSGYVRLAELSPTPSEAQNGWVLARDHFKHVKPEQLPNPADQPRFYFRATKARAATLPANATPAEINLICGLLGNVPVGESSGEANRLIADLALRLNPPNAVGAKAALNAYIAEAGLATPPASLARAKLRLSEVHLLLGETEPARKWLEQIKDAPPDVLAPAKAQLARILMSEGKWAPAANELEAVLRIQGLPATLRTMSLYYLGECRLRIEPPDPVAAAKRFEEAARSDGPEGPASTIRLAEIHLRSNDAERHKAAAGLLVEGVKGLVGPSGYKNPLLPQNEVQAVFELALQVLVTDAAFEPAVQVADAYKTVAAAGRDREKRAEVLAAWGDALQKSGGKFKPKLTAAADEYVALATMQPRTDGKAELLRRAAGLYRQAGSPQAALDAMQKVVEMPDLPSAVAGPAWVEYAEVLVVAHPNRPEEVIKAFNKAMAAGGPAGMNVRYRVARSLLDTRNPKLVPIGLALLEQVAGQSSVGPAEVETHEKALVELAHEYIQAGNFQDAEARLSVQLSRYPTGPEAGLGKLLKGICLLQLASAKAKPTDPEPALAPKMRKDALALFQEIVDDVEKREKAGSVSDRDRWLWAQASIRICQAHFLSGARHEIVTAAASRVIARYPGTVEELIVLSIVYHAQKRDDRKDLWPATRDRMKEVFEQLKQKPGAFRATSGEYSRDYWEKVWFSDQK